MPQFVAAAAAGAGAVRAQQRKETESDAMPSNQQLTTAKSKLHVTCSRSYIAKHKVDLDLGQDVNNRTICITC